MSENEGRRRARVLSPEAKWEVFLQVTSPNSCPQLVSTPLLASHAVPNSDSNRVQSVCAILPTKTLSLTNP